MPAGYLARREGRHGMDRMVRISRIAMAASLILAVTLSLGSAMLLSLVFNGSGGGQVAQDRRSSPLDPFRPG